jgi:hypothetical protein
MGQAGLWRCVSMRWIGISLLAVVLAGCTHVPTAGPDTMHAPKPASGSSAPGSTAPEKSASENKAEQSATSDPPVTRVWRVTEAPSPPAFGSAYISLANGTLVEMSCGEPYRIALWKRDPKDGRLVQVIEDKQPAFVGTIRDLLETTLRMDQKLTRSDEVRSLTLTAVDGEFVCPDLPK